MRDPVLVTLRVTIPYAMVPVGYPATGATVPALVRKPLDQVLVTV